MPVDRATTTTLTASCTTHGKQPPLTLTATVRATGATIPTGSVTFTGDGVNLGTAQLDANGRAVFTPVNLAEGVHHITATFPGTTSLDPSTSATLLLRVGPRGTCPERCTDEENDGEHADADKNRLLKRRWERRHHHREHGRLLTVQTFHTLHGFFGEGGHHGHHSEYWRDHRHHPAHKHHYYHKAHYKPHHQKHVYRPVHRAHAGVTG